MIKIRKATAKDAAQIRAVASNLLPQDFKGVLNTQQIDYMLDTYYSQKALEHSFQNGMIYFIASIDGKDAGYVSTVKEGPNLYLMQKIFVYPSLQRQGAGSALLEQVLQYASASCKSACQIEVFINQHNQCKNFYEKRGFKKVRDSVFDLGEFSFNEEVLSLNVPG